MKRTSFTVHVDCSDEEHVTRVAAALREATCEAADTVAVEMHTRRPRALTGIDVTPLTRPIDLEEGALPWNVGRHPGLWTPTPGGEGSGWKP